MILFAELECVELARAYAALPCRDVNGREPTARDQALEARLGAAECSAALRDGEQAIDTFDCLRLAMSSAHGSMVINNDTSVKTAVRFSRCVCLSVARSPQLLRLENLNCRAAIEGLIDRRQAGVGSTKMDWDDVERAYSAALVLMRERWPELELWLRGIVTAANAVAALFKLARESRLLLSAAAAPMAIHAVRGYCELAISGSATGTVSYA